MNNIYNPANTQSAIEHAEMALLVDRLVELRAKKSSIDTQVKELETVFKNMMVDAGATNACFESYEHVINVNEVTTNRTTWKLIAEHYGYSDYMFNKHTKASISIRLNVKTKGKQAA